MKRFKPVRTPAYQHPCAGSPLCTAKVPSEGQRCAVHRVWTDGPHDVPCCRCRQPIIRGDLYRRLDADDPASVAHAPCVARPTARTRERRETMAALSW